MQCKHSGRFCRHLLLSVCHSKSHGVTQSQCRRVLYRTVNKRSDLLGVISTTVYISFVTAVTPNAEHGRCGKNLI